MKATSHMLSRRSFLKQTSCCAAALAATNGIRCAQKMRRPNIIFLLTDDQRWDMLGAAGNDIIHTPNMDRLASDGTMFKNAFVTTAICVCSRASIFLGQYTRRHQINDFAQDFTPKQLATTYPMLLKQAGYTVGFIGKYGVGRTLPENQYDYWKGVPGQPKYETVDDEGKPIHCTRLFGNQAIEFIRSQSADQPFCLSVSFKAPHVQDGDPRQFIADPAYYDLYQDVTIPPPKTANPQYLEAMPEFMKSDDAMTRKRWRLRFEKPDQYQKMVKNYYRLVSGVDAMLGRIRDELDANGLADNTVIALLGDNGFFLGEYGFAGKWYGHEPSIHVPLIIYDPRLSSVHRGQVRDELALNIDIAPTFLELAGVTVPASIQGKSLVKLISGEKPVWRDEFLYEHLFHVAEKQRKTAGYIPSSVGVRTERYKYLRYFEQHPIYEELYDLKNDPHEEHNLAGSVEYHSMLEKLRQRCDELIEDKK